MSIFEGAGVAIVTPMNEDRSVNYEKLDEMLEMQISGKTDAIVICGTTGESATLSEEEHLDVIEHCVKTVKGRIPVIAGTGSNSTDTAIYLSQGAVERGVDACLVVTPYYNKATQKGLIAYYTAVARSIDKPIIIYNVPSRTGCNVAPATLQYLAEHESNIVGVKAASGNISQIAKAKQLCGDSIELYSGNDDQVVPICSLGGVGVISVLSNVAPEYTHDMVMNYLGGNTKKACEMQLKALPLIEALFCEVNPIPVKTALNLMGYQVGHFRGPLCEMEEANLERLKKAMIDFGLEVKA